MIRRSALHYHFHYCYQYNNKLAKIVVLCKTKPFSSTYLTSLTAGFKKLQVTVSYSCLGFVKQFLSNTGGLTGNEISLVNGDRIVTDDHELLELFTEYYMN